ncbi:MFS transporter [Paraburkholderia unamae]|uniref:ACS family phthalate transporter-like MFS transporter n=1 Tax=Paraburkholderia unamae TaxID=219649 RepID=A0ABX5KHP2_9BURK|nr:MFS transporter [Paraburkholderia unamae]PVX79966.1 ACS family phthalate transporter-like MFS transporter [Paraburkholderia unamae]CAG9268754.1 Phthalate transporter [Paraburkholderia unamae]
MSTHQLADNPNDPMVASGQPSGTAFSAEQTASVFRRVAARLVPFLFLCYVINYIDRVNLSFAHLQLRTDLNLSEAAFGFGVGIFFVGYVLFEVPSNLLMRKIGARKTIGRIMILWGIASAGMMFVQTPMQFYTARVVLGIAEAGFFPGIIFYLSSWFPDHLRARIISTFVLAIAVAGIVGGPISGWILSSTEGLHGMRSWQWLFLLEGIPAVLAGLFALAYLPDSPDHARWLSAAEREAIKGELARHQVAAGVTKATHHFGEALRNPKVYICTLGWFSLTWAGSILNYWAPAIIRQSGVTGAWHIGLLSAVPFIVGAIGMILFSRHSDATEERHFHFGALASLSAFGAIGLGLLHGDTVMAIVCLAVLAVGYLSCVAIFWTIPTGFLTGTAAAGAIALISSVAQIGGLIAPSVIGWMASVTHQLSAGSYVAAAVLFCGAAAIISIRPR